MTTDDLPLPTLLSRLLIAFTTEFDNEAEHRLEHRTTLDAGGTGRGPWLVSQAMWANFMQFVGGDGRPGNTLGVVAEGTDADGDPVQVEIGWVKNGQPAGTGKYLAAPAKRGDKVSVTVTPFDGKERGRSATLFREIVNTPPGIEGQEQFQVTDNAVTFHVRASDADGDPLMYSLKDAPAGMSIDRKTGVVRWMTSPGTTGKVPFTVVVSDGAGGESTARFTVTVAEQPVSVER